jgi:hypothetical protein
MGDQQQQQRLRQLGVSAEYTEHGWHSDRAGSPEEV